MDILDILLDADNREPITLMDEGGRLIKFEQVAVIPYAQKIYCVLKPLDRLEGVKDDEAIVFRVDETEDGNHVICPEKDKDVAIIIFEHYYDLLMESVVKKEEDDMELKRDNEQDGGKIVDMLFDKDAVSEITLVNEQGKELVCKQVYACRGDAVYCILVPVEEIYYMLCGGALLFSVSEENTLTVVKDRALSKQIFSNYYRETQKGGK